MGDTSRLGVNGEDVLLAVSKGCPFHMGDLVDVFVGTGHHIRGPKTIPVRGRFKGVRIEVGVERYMVRPIVGSQRGKCTSFPPESCVKLKAPGSDMYGESSPLLFSKMKPSSQERLVKPPPPPPSPPSIAKVSALTFFPPLSTLIFQGYAKGK